MFPAVYILAFWFVMYILFAVSFWSKADTAWNIFFFLLTLTGATLAVGLDVCWLFVMFMEIASIGNFFTPDAWSWLSLNITLPLIIAHIPIAVVLALYLCRNLHRKRKERQQKHVTPPNP